MKYTFDTEIDQPLNQVVELFKDPDNMKHWQTGLTSYKHDSGEPKQPGAQSQLTFAIAGQKIKMKETVVSNNLPEEFTAVYESKGIWNKVVQSFSALGDDRTLLRSEFEFKISGMMKIVSSLMPGMFKQQASTYMKNFKKFAENQTSGDW